MPLINCEINLILTWSSNSVITNSAGAGTFAIINRKLYVPTVTLPTQDNAKLLQQLKFGFKRILNWNKYLSKVESYNTRKPYFSKFSRSRLFLYLLEMMQTEQHTQDIVFQK